METIDSISVRSLFVSDLHIGTGHFQSGLFLDLLKRFENGNIEKLYLVGDIIDFICMKNHIYWKQEHNTVVQKLLRLSRKGVMVIYVPGNHDYFMRDFVGHQFGNIDIKSEVIHETVDGRKFLVLHGDEFDGILRNMTWCYRLGSRAYSFLILLDKAIHMVSRTVGYHSRWSLSEVLRSKVKDVVKYINNYKYLVSSRALELCVDGVICGHIHESEMSVFEGVEYINCGCWTTSGVGTVVVEDVHGKIHVVKFRED